MSSYIVLIDSGSNETQDRNQVPERVKALTDAAEKAGIQIRNIHWTSGTYAAVLFADASDNEAITSWVGSLGNTQLQVIPTLSADEISEKMARTSIRSLSFSEIIQWSY